MEYHREFNLQIAHFNNARAYELYQKALSLYEAGDSFDWANAIECLKECLTLIHGHNLKIGVSLYGDPPVSSSKEGEWKDVGYLVDDLELAEMIMIWDNTNLSVLPEFAGSGKRATTETIADMLCHKIFYKWKHLDNVQVSVWETPQIFAVSRRGRSVAY